MKTRKPFQWFFIAALLSTAGTGAMTVVEARAETPPVRVYDAAQLAPERYSVVKRIWTGTWHSAFWVPVHDDAAAAIAALTAKAADAGADGVVNLHCLNDDAGFGGGYFCYGLAIKLK